MSLFVMLAGTDAHSLKLLTHMNCKTMIFEFYHSLLAYTSIRKELLFGDSVVQFIWKR